MRQRWLPAGQALAEMRGPRTDNQLVLAVYDRQRWLLGAERSLKEMRHDRDKAVRNAVRGGVDRGTIREMTGLSLSRISQIVHYRR